MAPAGLAGRRHSQGVSRPAMARPPGEPRVSRSRPEGMRRRERQPPAGLAGRRHSQGVSRPAMARPPGEPRVSRSRPEGMRRRERQRHPWPRRAWPGVVTAKVRPGRLPSLRSGKRGVGPPIETAYLTSGAMDGGAQADPSERSPGWAQRTSGEMGGATPSGIGCVGRRLNEPHQAERLPTGSTQPSAATTRSPTSRVPCPILPAACDFIFVPVTWATALSIRLPAAG